MRALLLIRNIFLDNFELFPKKLELHSHLLISYRQEIQI